MYVFDAYGTLFDLDAAARKAATEPGMEALIDLWLPISRGWRERQLRYSWLCSMMGRYDDFWELTSRALDATLEEHGLASKEKVRDRLLSLYEELSAYEEVPGMLTNLKGAGHKLAVLSNASPNMLETATKAAGIFQHFDALISVDKIKCYKPTPAVYELVTKHFRCKPSDVSFFSSNNWDISGAGAFGFKTIWVNRNGAAWDKLPGFPDNTVATIAEGTKAGRTSQWRFLLVLDCNRYMDYAFEGSSTTQPKRYILREALHNCQALTLHQKHLLTHHLKQGRS